MSVKRCRSSRLIQIYLLVEELNLETISWRCFLTPVTMLMPDRMHL